MGRNGTFKKLSRKAAWKRLRRESKFHSRIDIPARFRPEPPRSAECVADGGFLVPLAFTRQLDAMGRGLRRRRDGLYHRQRFGRGGVFASRPVKFNFDPRPIEDLIRDDLAQLLAEAYLRSPEWEAECHEALYGEGTNVPNGILCRPRTGASTSATPMEYHADIPQCAA